MSTVREIALAFPVTAGVHQEVVHGIMNYAQKRDSWTFFCGSETLAMSVLSLKGWPGHGVIANVVTLQEARAAARLGIPVVNLSGALDNTRLPRVMNDHQAIGRLAAEHLLDREFRRFGYYGLKHAWYSRQRGLGFCDRVRREGYPCSVLETLGVTETTGTWRRWREELRRWLAQLQTPFAVMAAHDLMARMITDTCRHMGLHVPHDVAVVGVGNDPLICESSRPTLSSVARRGQEIGYRAAELLDRLMSGRQPSQRNIIVAPAGVVGRQSSDVVAVDEPDLSRAIQFMRENMAHRFTIDDVAREAAVSRRWLEYRFQQRFGRSPYEYLRAIRVSSAQQLLLASPDMPSQQLAKACGFSDARGLRSALLRLAKITLREQRRKQAAANRGGS